MKIKLPVVYEVCGMIEVEADSIEDAVNNFYEDCDHIPLPTDTDYVDGSFELATEDAEIISNYQ